MLDRLRQFLLDLNRPEPEGRVFEPRQMQLAAAALLVHVAEIDGQFSPSERRSLVLLLEQRFELDEAGAQKLVEAAQKSDHAAIDLHRFTSMLRHAMTAPERRRLVEMMWTVAYADGEAQEFEENIVTRVADLIEIPARDCAALRAKARADAGLDPDGPAWDASSPEARP
jgi:uncharacterized tellurite resistance protein B-like protein